jgi:hypothetical protein
MVHLQDSRKMRKEKEYQSLRINNETKTKIEMKAFLLAILLILGCYSCYCIDIKSMVILGKII